MAREEFEWQLEDYLRAFWLHRWILTTIPLLFCALTWAQMARIPNVYRATSRILLETTSNQTVPFQEVGPIANPSDRIFLRTEYEVIASRAVLSRVVEELNLAAFPPFSDAKDPIEALKKMVLLIPVHGTKLVDISVTGTKPELIARLANAVAETYARLNLERRRDMTTGGADWLREEVDRVGQKMRAAHLKLQEFRERHGTVDFGEEHYNTVLQQLASLNAALSKTREERIEAELKYRQKHPKLKGLRNKEQELQLALFDQEQRALELSRLSIQYNTLSREANASEQVYNVLLNRLEQLSVQEGMQTNNVQIVDYALVPTRPIGPARSQRVIIFTLLGLLVGMGLALFRERLNKTLRTRRDFERLLEIPFLGHVPIVRQQSAYKGQILSPFKHSASHAADSLRSIRTTLEFLLPAHQSHLIMITSALPEEGKSFVCANLALALQELGRKVLLIDADLRRPTVHKNFQTELEPGLSTYLQGEAGIGNLIQFSSAQNDLPIIPAGLTPKQPADLLIGPKLKELLAALKQTYQYILFDTPPVLAVADSSALAGAVEHVIFIARAQRTHREAIQAGKQRLADVGAKIIGGILNCARIEQERGYRYYYYTRYYSRYPAVERQAGQAKDLSA